MHYASSLPTFLLEVIIHLYCDVISIGRCWSDSWKNISLICNWSSHWCELPSWRWRRCIYPKRNQHTALYQNPEYHRRLCFNLVENLLCCLRYSYDCTSDLIASSFLQQFLYLGSSSALHFHFSRKRFLQKFTNCHNDIKHERNFFFQNVS